MPIHRVQKPRISTFCFLVTLLVVQVDRPAIASTQSTDIPTGSLLWQIGVADDLYNEFADFHRGPEIVEIPSVGATIDASDCAKISRGVGAQMAVFSNGSFAGLIQLWGTDGTDYPYQWRKTYRLYIPKEFLKAGQNELRLMAPHAMWGDVRDDGQQWWMWDYLKFQALDDPIAEPWHGKISYLGTTMTMSGDGFTLNDDTLRLAPVVLEWLGIAYSGNTLRANFWYDVASQQPRRMEYLQLLARYNMPAAPVNQAVRTSESMTA